MASYTIVTQAKTRVSEGHVHVIPDIENGSGVTLTSLEDIKKECRCCFELLYRERQVNERVWAKMFDTLPRLTERKGSSLEEPVTREECWKALSLQKG